MRKIYGAILAVGLLAGAPWAVTHALFTDSTTIDSNSFASGTVDIATGTASALITFSNMAPGDATTQSLAVSNAGTLAQRYSVSSSATNADAKALKDQLVLTIKTIDVTTPASPCDNFDGSVLYSGDLDSTAGKLVGDSTAGAHSGDRTLAASASETLCFRTSLPTATGDLFQNAASTVTFTLSAEQTTNN